MAKKDKLEEIMLKVTHFLEGKFSACEFYDDDKILNDLYAIVDKTFDSVYDLLVDADRSIDYEIENWNQNYREGAREAYLKAEADDRRTQDELEKDLF